MNRKSIVAALVALLLVVVLAAPAFGSGQPESAKAASSQTMEVTLAIGAAPPQKEGLPLQKYLEDMFKFKFKLVAYDAKERDRQLSVMFAAGEIPDILSATFAQMVQWYDKGIIRELPLSLIKANMPAFAKWTDEIDPTLWNYTKWKGKQVGITNASANGGYSIPIVWRTDLLKAAGMTKAPETVAEWEDALKKMKSAKGISPLSAPGFQTDPTQIGNWFGPIFGAYGALPGLWLKKADGKVVFFFEDPGYLAALKTLAAWYKAGLIDPEWVTTAASDRSGTTEDLFVKFARGKIAVLYNVDHTDFKPWDWYDNEVQSLASAEETARWQAYNEGWEKTKAFEVWTVGAPPKGPAGLNGTYKTTLYSNAIVIGSKNDDARAARLLGYLETIATNPEVYVRIFAGGPGDFEVNTEPLDWKSSPTGKTYHWSQAILDMDAGKRAKDDHHYSVWSGGYFGPFVHWSPNIKYIWYGDVLEERDKLAKTIAKYPGYNAAFALPLPSATQAPDLNRVVAEFTMKAISGGYGDIDGAYQSALASWKKGGGDVLTKEANDLHGGK